MTNNQYENLDKKRPNSLRLIFTILGICLVIYFINYYGVERLRDQVEEIGYWAPLAIFVLRSTSIILPALPSTAYSLLAGALLGFQKGILLICISDLIACTISFYISRNYGRQLVRTLIGNKFIYQIEEISKRHLENNFFLMTGFLMTGLFDFVSYAIGLSKTPWRKFAPALIISILLSNPPIVALGAGLLEGGKKIVFLGLFGIFLLAIITGRLKRTSRIQNK